jgi:hypothetical protein
MLSAIPCGKHPASGPSGPTLHSIDELDLGQGVNDLYLTNPGLPTIHSMDNIPSHTGGPTFQGIQEKHAGPVKGGPCGLGIPLDSGRAGFLDISKCPDSPALIRINKVNIEDCLITLLRLFGPSCPPIVGVKDDHPLSGRPPHFVIDKVHTK